MFQWQPVVIMKVSISLMEKRYSHTIDPRTLSPIRHNLASVTVIAKNCMLADAYATAFTVIGKDEAMNFVNRNDNLEAYFITRSDDGSFDEFYSKGFEKTLSE
jgi:FAD:protein FMN transferase